MGVPAWLLKIVIAFLSNRRMLVRYKGSQSGVRHLPRGGPQGTLLGLFLFIILINDAGFDGQANNAGDIVTTKRNMKTVNEIHLKYIDDLTLAEAINLPKMTKFKSTNERPLPDLYNSRTGHVLPEKNSSVFRKLLDTKEYADENEMQINFKGN